MNAHNDGEMNVDNTDAASASHKAMRTHSPKEPTMPVLLLKDRLSRSGRSHPFTTMVSLLIRATYFACAS